MARPCTKRSILNDVAFVILFLHECTACYARNWRMMREETQKVAEVIHMPSSILPYRRQLQTGTYCVAVSDANQTALQAALDWACGTGQGQGNVDCSSLQVGGACYLPDTVQAHASYAFDTYYVNQNAATGSCNFNGLATTTTTNPSSTSTCVYQAYTGTNSNSNSSSTTGTPPPPSTTTPSSNDTGTIFSPPGDNSTTGSTNFSPSPFNVIYWLYSLCGGIIFIAFW